MPFSTLSLRKEAFVSLAASVIIVSFLLGIPTARAQRDAADIPTVTNTIALVGARIVQSPGRVVENGILIVRDGLIERIGESIPVPFDAEIVRADSMTIYAAFIDGLSTTGVPKPEREENQPRVDDPGNPPNDRAGIQPERDVRSMLSASEKSVAAMRGAGFGASQIVPEGRMLPGSAAVILLGGGPSERMIFRGQTALFAQFVGGRGVYPATPMGMTAKFRQLYREATRRHSLEKSYGSDPGGRRRPPYDAVHAAFFPVIDRTQPVLFFVDDALEIHRALKLQRELGFNLTLAGLNEAFDAYDELAEAKLPLFLTVDLPEKPKWMAKLEQDSLDTLMDSFSEDTRTATYRDLEAEKRNLEARQLISRGAFASVAARLNERGLTFGFAAKGVKPAEIRSNIKEMIDNGLSEDAALAALTSDAAELLGLGGSLGSIDEGKIANLLVVDGPLFDPKTHYRYVLIEGKKYSFEVKEKKSALNGERPVSIIGTWTFTAHSPDGDQTGTVIFSGSPDSYSGTIDYDDGNAPHALTDISFDDGTLSFSWQDPQNGAMTVSGSVSSDQFEGTVDIGGQSLDVSGELTNPGQ